MASQAHQLVSEIQSIYHSLSNLSSLAPGEQTNALLTRLVNLSIAPYSTDFVAYFLSINGIDNLCRQLRPLCATAEGELERYWARHIIDASSNTYTNPSQTRSLLHSFPYYQNYLDLSRLECSTLEAFLETCSPDCRPSPCKIAFLGSGPMPLTSFCILDRYPEAIVHNVDRDVQALQIGQALSGRLGYGDRMTFACEDVSASGERDGRVSASVSAQRTDWKAYQVVFLAALVGMDTESKLSILESLGRKLEAGTIVVARSAQGLRSVLYPVLELSDNLQRIGFDMLVEVHPWTKVVNSVIVLRVREH